MREAPEPAGMPAVPVANADGPSEEYRRGAFRGACLRVQVFRFLPSSAAEGGPGLTMTGLFAIVTTRVETQVG